MHLLQSGEFILHSGLRTSLKIDCDALSDEDLTTIAKLWRHRPVYKAIGIGTGGTRLARFVNAELRRYDHDNKERVLRAIFGLRTKPESNILLVDDVYTTGGSMERRRDELEEQGYNVYGAVIFARQKLPQWITAIFHLDPALGGSFMTTTRPITTHQKYSLIGTNNGSRRRSVSCLTKSYSVLTELYIGPSMA